MATNISSVRIADGTRIDYYYTEAGTMMVCADGKKRRASNAVREAVELAKAEADAKAKAKAEARKAEAEARKAEAEAKAKANAEARTEAAKRKAEAEAEAEAQSEAEAEARKAEAAKHAKRVQAYAEKYSLYGAWDIARGDTMGEHRGLDEAIMAAVEAAWDALDVAHTIAEAQRQRIEYTRGKYVVQRRKGNAYEVIGSIPCPMVRGSVNMVELYASTMGNISAADLTHRRIPWAYKQTADLKRAALNYEAADGTRYRFALNRDGNASPLYLSWSAFSKAFVERVLLSAAVHASAAVTHTGCADVRVSYVPTERGRIGYAMTADERKERETEAARAAREKTEAAKRLRKAREATKAYYARKEADKLNREAVDLERELIKLNATA